MGGEDTNKKLVCRRFEIEDKIHYDVFCFRGGYSENRSKENRREGRKRLPRDHSDIVICFPREGIAKKGGRQHVRKRKKDIMRKGGRGKKKFPCGEKVRGLVWNDEL